MKALLKYWPALLGFAAVVLYLRSRKQTTEAATFAAGASFGPASGDELVWTWSGLKPRSEVPVGSADIDQYDSQGRPKQGTSGPITVIDPTTGQTTNLGSLLQQ